MQITKVFILSNQPLFAEGVQSLLSGQSGIKVVGVASVDPDVFDRVRAIEPDVVVIEAEGGEQGSLVTQMLKTVPGARVVVLSLEDNRIHTYYQQMKQGRRIEDLLEAIRGPMNWQSRRPRALRLFVLFQGRYGRRILGNVRGFAPANWTVNDWQAPSNLPPVIDDPLPFLPQKLPPSDLVLSLGESGSVAQLLPSIVERTGAGAVIAPVDNVAWLPEGLARQLRAWLEDMGVTAVFPKPFCSLTEWSYGVRQQQVSYEGIQISEFARCFGRPVLQIDCDDGQIEVVTVVRDTACGCGRAVASQLVGVDVEEAVLQAGLLHHHYPCLATMCVDPNLGEPLIQVAGGFMRHTVEVGVSAYLSQTLSPISDMVG